uniref:Large ribosomal subunit protein bL21c n=1 Tax=Dichotomaria marginata TaxID=268567 RepID=A0A1G4NS18_9FLOR|nr:Ribosomal protein L21 [Dichotomaria marginata]SCW21460.1 Ribosomal protein L21 [Dichotomaria marginata]
MSYAIIEISGKQIWIQPGRFYDINKIKASPGEHIKLEKILFIKNNDKLEVGQPCLNNAYIIGKVLKHLKSRKITIFKMKPKKNMRSKNGHRQSMSRILIESMKTTTI